MACPFRIHFPASLGSTGITPLHRYYGRSDFCSADLPVGGFRSMASGVSALSGIVANVHQTMSVSRSAALIRADLQDSWIAPSRSFRLHPPLGPDHRFVSSLLTWSASAAVALGAAGGIWASPQTSRLAAFQAVLSSSSYGPIVRLTLLRTPPHGDALTFLLFLATGTRTMPGMDFHHPVAIHFPAH